MARMLKNLMEDKQLDFDAPLLSVRRFSAPDSASSNSNSRQSDRFPEKKPPPLPPKRSSLPFYRSELKSGPIRNPGVVPFVWEQTPGQPKSGDPQISGDPIARPLGRPPAAPKVPPKSIPKDEKTDAYAPFETKKPVNSVRTRERISASPNGDFLISSESSSISPQQVNDEKQQQQQQQQQQSMPTNYSKEDDDDDAFTDALDMLSCAESSFINCSISGLSDDDTAGPSGGRLADPQVRDFMMGRFLPASVAASSPQCNPRKLPARRLEPERSVEREGNGDYRPPFSMPYGYGPGSVPRHAQGQEEVEIGDDDDYEEEDYSNAGHFSSKACGLLPQFCFKSSFCLLNPVPRMKARSFLPQPHGRRINSPQIRTLHHQSLGQTEDEHSWEAVYKHKLGHGDQQSGEVGSKLTSESNHLTCSSDSLTADGSSPFRRSIGGSISPYRNESPRFDEGKCFLGVPKGENQRQRSNEYITCEKDYDNCSEIATHEPSQQGSSLTCTEIEKKLYLDTVNMPETPCSKSSSPNTIVDDSKGTLNPVVDDSEVGAVSQGIKDSLVIDSFHIETPQSKISENVDNTFNHDNNSDSQLPLKVEKQVQNDDSFVPSILPPPLPNSPSESWLSRKLPSVSSKNPSRKSLLGIQVKYRKQDLVRFSADPKQESDVKPVKVHRQIRFADMLTKPLSPESEI